MIVFFFLKICRHESILIEEIVSDISNKLIWTSLSYAEGLVGMDSLLCMGLDNVRSVGILGMGGIGTKCKIKESTSCKFK